MVALVVRRALFSPRGGRRDRIESLRLRLMGWSAERGLIGVRDVEEAVGVLSLLVHFGHQGVALEDVPAVHEKVQRVLLWQSDSLADDEAELVGGQVIRCQEPT